jgi:RPA family protein
MYQPEAAAAMKRLERGDVPALSTLMQKCSDFQDDGFIVVKAECVMKASPE